MQKILFSIMLLIALSIADKSYGQSEESRIGSWYILPEAGLQFGYITYLDITTLVGWHITDRLSFGAGPHFNYYQQKASYFNPASFSTSLYGAKVFSRYSLIRHGEEFIPYGLLNELFVHLEYEALSLERAYFDYPLYPATGRFWLNSLFIGGGITQLIGSRSSIYYMILWNLNERGNIVYNNPLYRVGLNIYF
jgi:hypothetical protein